MVSALCHAGGIRRTLIIESSYRYILRQSSKENIDVIRLKLMGVYRLFGYFKFLRGSTNQHGVHSPFIYNYLTKCLQLPRQKNLTRTEDILINSIHYFKFCRIGFMADAPKLRAHILEYCQEPSFGHLPLDLIYVKAKDSRFKKIDPQQIHNGSMLFVSDIYEDQQSYKNWKTLKHMDQARITVDLFYCGLIFFRKQQAPQHFKLRI
jgi:hypothetical protein